MRLSNVQPLMDVGRSGTEAWNPACDLRALTSVWRLSAGPLLGDQLIDALDWRSLFYTRAPIGSGGMPYHKLRGSVRAEVHSCRHTDDTGWTPVERCPSSAQWRAF